MEVCKLELNLKLKNFLLISMVDVLTRDKCLLRKEFKISFSLTTSFKLVSLLKICRFWFSWFPESNAFHTKFKNYKIWPRWKAGTLLKPEYRFINLNYFANFQPVRVVNFNAKSKGT